MNAMKRRQRGFIIDPYRFGAAAATGLLDSYTTNLWGAYGLVLLRGNYAGSAIRVRESGGNTEADIGFTGTALNTTALASFVGANDGFIVKWYDQSGGANDLAQATSGAQAKIVEAGTYMGEVCFDGVDDQMVTANSSGTPTAFTAYLGGRERLGAASADGVLFRHESGQAQLHQTRNTTADNYSGRILCGAGSGINDFDDALTSYPAAYAAVLDRAGTPGITGQAMLWINGTQQASIATVGVGASGSYTANAWRLGSDTANFTRLGLSSFLIYEAAHTSGYIGSISMLIKPAAKVDTLDSYTTNLWGLYSLRRLRSAYVGSAIRVRESGGNTEADIGFNATTHLLDTAALATHVGANSGYVVTWYDQSGGGNNFSQATAANQPRIVNAGTVDRGLTFDGTNDGMSTAASSGTPTGLSLYFLGNAESGVTKILLEQNSNYDNTDSAHIYRGTNQLVVGHGDPPITNRAEYNYNTMAVGQVLCARTDRSAGTAAAQIKLYSGGREVTQASSNSVGAVPAGAYVAGAWFLGQRSGGTLCMTGDIETAVIYETAQTAALIETISRAIG